MEANSSADLPESYLSPSEYAALTGFSMATVRRYLDAGILPKHQPGGPRSRIGIPRSALDLKRGAPEGIGDTNDRPPEAKAENAANARPRRYGPGPRWLTLRNKE